MGEGERYTMWILDSQIRRGIYSVSTFVLVKTALHALSPAVCVPGIRRYLDPGHVSRRSPATLRGNLRDFQYKARSRFIAPSFKQSVAAASVHDV